MDFLGKDIPKLGFGLMRLPMLGGEVENIFFYNLLEERDRVIVVVRKKKKTDQKYPRRTGIPAKRPL
jgi:16S rRNA (guanine527-N7)-methyltransferase